MIDIIIPSINEKGLCRFISSVDDSIQEKWNLIVVSPYFLEFPKTKLMNNVTNIIDKGSPSRCLQMGTTVCTSEIFTWGTDDGVLKYGELKKTIDILRTKPNNHGMIVKYTENGPGNFTGMDNNYYISKFHHANRQPGIDPNWKIAPVGMFYTSYFKSIGGLDCRFEHMNMNVHDFCYRLQKDGGELHYSPDVVMHCDSNNWSSDHNILDDAYKLNDLPLFIRLYKDSSREIIIDYDNWKNSSEVWRRFQ